MIMVVIALVPAALFGMYNVGLQTSSLYGLNWTFWHMFFYGLLRMLPLFVVSYVVGLGIEFASAQIRGEEVNEGYLVTGFLIPLIVPVDVPLWMLALAVAFSVLFVKEVFGGTGMNIWNPALVARAFLFFSYPSSMSGSSVWVSKTFLVPGCQFPQDEILRHVRILVLVHHNMRKAAGDVFQRFGGLFQQDVHVEEDVVKIHHTVLLAGLAVEFVHLVDVRFLVVFVVLQVTATCA